MAQIKLSNQIVSIRGRFGGVYFKKDGGVQHVQAMPRHINYARHGTQLKYTSSYSRAAGFWLLALLAFYALEWAAYAAIHLFSRPGQRAKRIHGYNWYIHYALTFPERDEFHPFWKPPHAPGDLPNFVATYQGKWTYYNNPQVWPSDCCSGYYWDSFIPWNGKPAYRTDDFNWHIWWEVNRWAVSPGPGFVDPGKTFYSPGPEICAWYKNSTTGKRVHIYNGRRPGYVP